MQKIYAGLLVVALAMLAAPVNAATETTYDKNVAFWQNMVGDQDYSAEGVMPDGSLVTLGDAFHVLAARAGDVDLSARVAGAGPADAPDGAGDVWVYEFGLGGCTNTVIAPGSPTFVPIHGQMWIYAGAIGTQETSHGYYTFIDSWTTKAHPYGFNTAGYTATGNQDFFCIDFGSFHLGFPFVNGVASFN